MQDRITRRTAVKGGLLLGTMVPALGLIRTSLCAPADLPALDLKDPLAVTLGFVSDASKVDAAKNPRYTPDQKCSNCEQFQGKASDARGGCVVIPGKSVPAAGWCKVWRKMP